MAKIKKIKLKNETYDIDVVKDWNQNDDDSTAYIANRTHYIDDEGEVHQLEAKYIPIAEGTALKVEGGKLKVDQLTTDNVVFTEDLTFTKEFGYYGTEGDLKSDLDTKGNYTIPAAGESINTILSTAFAKDRIPEVTQPRLTLIGTNFQAYEVGSEVTVSAEFEETAGTYPFGPATGVTWSNRKVTLGGNTKEILAADTFVDFNVTVIDTTNLQLTGQADHSDGVVPNTALGEPYPDAQIDAKTVSVSYNTLITGYRKMFVCTYANQEVTLNSDAIRMAQVESIPKTSIYDWSVPISEGAKKVVIAIPKDLTLTKVLDSNDSNANIIGSFNLESEDFEILGENNYRAPEDERADYLYKLYVMDSAVALNSNTYKISISR